MSIKLLMHWKKETKFIVHKTGATLKCFGLTAKNRLPLTQQFIQNVLSVAALFRHLRRQ
jgi:hypothetical protein